MQRVQLLHGLLVQRSDDTFMLFHPSFREWLTRREENESTKFLCDARTGHAAIALRLSRLEAPLDAEKENGVKISTQRSRPVGISFPKERKTSRRRLQTDAVEKRRRKK